MNGELTRFAGQLETTVGRAAVEVSAAVNQVGVE